MASSSLSQEDVDHDFELSSRRSRIRSARANARNAPPCRAGMLSDGEGESRAGDPRVDPTQGDATGEHEASSPKPSSRAKEKRCPRPNHVNKGKAQRERRKLREKRRSTGVVHLPSTESTGGSTGEDEELLAMSVETKRNTAFNETPLDRDRGTAEVEGMPKTLLCRSNKSPSDLDADDEDNQDYDSAVNQSDSTLSLFQDAATCDRSSWRSQAINGRPETPCSENLEDLLERAHEENKRLLGLLKEKDDFIGILEQKISSISEDLSIAELEKSKLQDENQTLLSRLAELRAE